MFSRFFKDVRAASSGEYALLLALIGAAIALAAFALGGAIGGGMDKSGEVIASAGASAAPAPPADSGTGTGSAPAASNPNAHGGNPKANPKAGPANPGQGR